jgi:hypothetical protein
MPERTNCDEAIQFSRTRLRIPEPDLKDGQVEMFQIPTANRIIQRPWGIEGGFAVVYKFRTASGKLRALRCFRVPMNPDTQSRYELMGPYFFQHAPTITATFKYYQQGLMIKETVSGSPRETIYPLIDMEWVEGDILLDKVDALCQEGDRQGLEQLIQEWLALLSTLQQGKIAHGDLSGNNIIVCPDGRLILIDYDGCYIPALAGRDPIVAGQPDYQHHQMQQRAFDEHMDHFSALVIYTALVALQAEPALWQAHMEHRQGKLIGTHLLFLKEDYLNPDQSVLFAKLEQMNNARVTASVQALKQACYKQIDDVVFPWELVEADYMEKQQLAQALKQFYSVILHQSSPRNAQEFLAAYDPILDAYPESISQEERALLATAQRFVDIYPQLLDALQKNDAKRISKLYSPDLEEFLADFTPQQRQLLKEAHKQCHLDELLTRNAYKEALELAYEIEKATQTLIYDTRLVLARQKFIRQFDAKEVTVQLLHGNGVMIRWLWPDNDLVEIAFVLCRPDRWPLPPPKREHGTQLSVVIRQPNERYGSLHLSYPDRQVYVHVFMAIADYTQQRANWFYSRGKEPTSRKAASL